MTPAGIEPATFRFVAQRLNHCAKDQRCKQQEVRFTNCDLNCLFQARLRSHGKQSRKAPVTCAMSFHLPPCLSVYIDVAPAGGIPVELDTG